MNYFAECPYCSHVAAIENEHVMICPECLEEYLVHEMEVYNPYHMLPTSRLETQHKKIL